MHKLADMVKVNKYEIFQIFAKIFCLYSFRLLM